ncbi:MAG: Spy/CpxP family protein refolding chaperone [Acidiferrobacterales bacterium]
MNRKIVLALITGAFVVIGISAAVGHGGSPGYSRGYGMGGPGMMGGHMGPGMAGFGGMYDMPMMGPGMGHMGATGSLGPVWMLDLSNAQHSKIHAIRDELRKKKWKIMGEIMDESSKLSELYRADRPDPKKIGAVYAKIFDLRRQMIETTVAARNRQRDVLTDEQRAQLNQWRHGRPGRAGPGYGFGPHGQPGMQPMHRGMMGG